MRRRTPQSQNGTGGKQFVPDEEQPSSSFEDHDRVKRGIGKSLIFLLLVALLLDTVGVVVNFKAFRRLVNEPNDFVGDFVPRIVLLDSKLFDAQRGRAVEDLWMDARDPQYKFFGGNTGLLRNPVTLDGKPGEDVCKPAAEWQERFYTNCNEFHELDFEFNTNDKGVAMKDRGQDGSVLEMLGVGTMRDAWKVAKTGDEVVLKTLQLHREFSERTTYYQIVDAVAAERLTSSPYVEDIYGFCGSSVLNELGREFQLEEGKPVTTLDKLRYARDLAAGLADAHGIDGAKNAHLVHADLRHSNVLFSKNSDTVKLSDFNQGYFLGWNKNKDEMCGYRPKFEFWQDQFSAPEECKGQVQTEKTDIYHMGGLIYYLLTGAKPYAHNEEAFSNRKEIVSKGRWPMPSIPKSFLINRHPAIVALVEAINQSWSYDAKDRPTAREIHRKLEKVLVELKTCRQSPMANGKDTSKFLSKMPNVLLVGAQKAGTTATASWMFHHQKVCKPISHESEEQLKELHFYDDKSLYEQGLDLYGKHFCHCGDNTHVLDATPNYLPLAEKVKETYEKFGKDAAKDLKIVAVLREPVGREFSWYNHMIVDTQTSLDREYTDQVKDKNGNMISFDEYVNLRVIPRIEKAHGLYGKWIKKWIELFGRKNVLVLSYDELLGDQPKFMQRLRDFLGLEKRPDGGPHQITQFNVKVNADADKPAPSCKIQKKLAAAFEKSNKELYELLESNPGPAAEQRPFQKFKLGRCKE